MKTELNTIIMDGMDVVECIRREALIKNTVRRPLEDITQIDWQNTTELYILGDDSTHIADGGLEAGCYMDSVAASQVIVIGASNERITRIINCCGGNLHRLDLRFLDMESLELPTRFSKLEQLRLSPMEQLREIKGLGSLGGLKELDLSFTNPGTAFDATRFPMLRRLELAGNTDLTQVEELSKLAYLEELDLSGTSVGSELNLSTLHNLKQIRLVDTDKLEKAYGFGESGNLEYIDLSCSGITRIPDDIQDLKKLMHLDLSNLSLDYLPDWLLKLGLDFTYCEDGINLRGTKVLGVDTTLFSEKATDQNFADYQKRVKEWFAAQKEEVAKPLNEIKVVFLGDGEAGKSHTIARLMNDGGEPDYAVFDGQSTPGIVVRNKEYDLDGRRITVHYWDFGGQEIMHSMHRMFLTARTIYVVILNARDKTQDDRAKYWLHNIRSFANDAPVILVLNKIDQNENASVNERDLRVRYPNLMEIVRLSALKFSRDEFNANLTATLMRQIAASGYLDAQFPAAWMRLKDRLLSLTGDFILAEEYDTLCDSCGIEAKGETRKELLHWFDDLGFLFYLDGALELEDIIVLNPNWITNALYIILFNRLEDARNGLIPHRSIFNLLKAANSDPNIRSTLPQTRYTTSDVPYILGIMRKFNLSFTDGHNNEFIPMLCQQNSTVDVLYYHKDADVLEFSMEFDYLPTNLLHRLMVDRRSELDIENAWRTGARFHLRELGFSAVVVIDDNILRFYIRHTDPMHRPNTYLAMLKVNVERIAETMGLGTPTSWLIYKLDGKRDVFDFDMLKIMQEMGQPQAFSMTWRKMIPITDILNQSAPEGMDDEKKLLNAIRHSCMSIQDEPIYHLIKNASAPGYVNGVGMEDLRNRRLRDGLMMQGYRILDQSQRGRSGTGKGLGEFDILIHNERGEPWTVIEALRISNGAKGEWNNHLYKLLDNYNVVGLRVLYLLTYVDADPSTFARIWHSYQAYIPQYSPGQHTYMDGSFVDLNDADSPQYIKTAKCQYSRGSDPITVYHIFARIPTQNG